MGKKSFNPFKMWGSWVGGVIAVLLPEFFFINMPLLIKVPGWIVQDISIIVSFILGFFIGYGIHALVRALRR